jgi:DnaJ-class molecular chaperone
MADEYPCPTCGGGGKIQAPRHDVNEKGELVVVQDVIDCITCGGSGKVTA